MENNRLNRKFVIRDVTDSDFWFYIKCFSDNSWFHKYGLNDKIDLLKYANNALFGNYPYVKRKILQYSESISPLGFFHIDLIDESEKTCILSGGIDPFLLNSGIGIKLACIAIDYIFGNHKVLSILADVCKHNDTSFRMLQRIGFLIIDFKLNEKNTEKIRLKLEKNLFPNFFVNTLLKKISYEKR